MQDRTKKLGTIMIKKVVSATAVAMLLFGAASAWAETVEYTFGITGGGAYCDGLTLSENQNQGIAVGTHTGDECPDGQGGYAGGSQGGRLENYKGYYWFIVTTDAQLGDRYQLYFILDQQQLTYTLYEQSTENKVTFQAVKTGPLLKGAPADLQRAGVVLSSMSVSALKQ